MSSIFYYFGFLYIIYLIRTIIGSLKKDDFNFKDALSIEISPAGLERQKELFSKLSKKTNPIWIGIYTLSFFWNMAGYEITSSNLFLAGIVIFIFEWLLIIITAVTVFFKEEIKSENNPTVNLSFISLSIQLLIVADIMYQYFVIT